MNDTICMQSPTNIWKYSELLYLPAELCSLHKDTATIFFFLYARTHYTNVCCVLLTALNYRSMDSNVVLCHLTHFPEVPPRMKYVFYVRMKKEPR